MYYFAYGSNMDYGKMASRCPHASLIDVASLHGYRFQINSRGVATIVQYENGKVYGILWDLTQEDALTLDKYEGVGAGFYRRAAVTVELASGCQVEALIYVATDYSLGSPRYEYMENILTTAKHYQFPISYIQELTKWLSTDG